MVSQRLLVPAALFLLFGCSPSDVGRGGQDVALQQKDGAGVAQEILALHNRERSPLRMAPLRWDEGLAAGAAAYGVELARLGRLVHSPPSSRPGQGENLWMGTHGVYSPAEMVGSWAREKAMFRPGRFPDVSTTGSWADVAHYTQMIWRTTTRLGCAIHEGPQRDYFVCRYAPAGNVVGEAVP